MRAQVSIGSVAAIALAACVSTRAVLLDPAAPRLPSLCPEAVQVFGSPDRVSGEYTEVAYLFSRGPSGEWAPEEDMVNSMRERAAKLGANGIIMPVGGIQEGVVLTAEGGIENRGRRARALAIFIQGDSLRVQRACSWSPRERR